MISQKQLYLHNRNRLRDISSFDPDLRRFERQWIDRVLASDASAMSAVTSCDQLLDRIDQRVQWEAQHETEESRYVREAMTRPEFRILVQEFALDGLTEAQSFYYIMPRLPLTAQLPMLRILIDEFGSANPQRMHTTLYVNLLRELDMTSAPEPYLDLISEASFAFVNQFYWMTIRADDPSWFAGAITYLESVIPHFFPCYVAACERLGISAHHYYSEHCHIDRFHALEGRRLLAAMNRERALDPCKAWQGVCLASTITTQAFADAVHKARGNRWPSQPQEQRHEHSAA
ncbi:MAG: iron-containing redox enzyme family protein [Gammaproteobacteria bacterium]|nr:iron-containing redox enzyme family protein [Gammaproteobacteria bacterium]